MTAASMLGRTAALLSLLTIACTGLSQGEKGAGKDTYLAFGDIGVDDRTETSFVLTSQPDAGHGDAGMNQTLVAVGADAGSGVAFKDLTGFQNLRILFPSTGVLVMSQKDQQQHLDLFNMNSLQLMTGTVNSSLYNGTRMSPSRNWLAVADNAAQYAPINIVDMRNLQVTVVPHGGDWLEAMWLNQSDVLVAIVFYDIDKASAHARVMSWRMDQVQAAGFQPDSSGYWPDPLLDIDVPGAVPDYFFSYTWVGINPNDTQVVLPVEMQSADDKSSTTPTLLVVDLATGALRTVPNARGPVGFTPDGKTIVSYTTTQLELIDATTLTQQLETVPIKGGLTYFVSHEGNYVVVGSAENNQRLVLYDTNNHTMTQMAGPGVALDEFVARPGHEELWIVDNSALFRMDLLQGTFTVAPTSFSPYAINILPKSDRLVMDGDPANDLFFYDPNTLTTTATVPLPGGTFTF